MQVLEGMDRKYYPLSDWLHDTLRQHTVDVIPSLSRHTMVFDRTGDFARPELRVQRGHDVRS